ncbi:major facilitator superfamily domain-containing protein [Xylariaceae sp. FL0016]|nr:major facilitator superfamily domain-containing protein [Xylariaceae sp. FL0016]
MSTSTDQKRTDSGAVPSALSEGLALQKTPTKRGHVITEEEYPEVLGFHLSNWKKWTILTVIFLVQTSMNFNTSLYANGQAGIEKQFGVSHQESASGAAIFLILYAFGCELWAPWSEEFGRRIVIQASLTLVNIFCLPVALASSFGAILAGRALGGLSTAGGSVTLGMVADMFDSDSQGLPLAFIVLSSVGGSVLGPIVGGPVEAYLPWQWTIWIQLIFGVLVQVLHFVLVPETRSSVLLDRHAKKLRKTGEMTNAYGPNELKTWREYLLPSDLIDLWLRPFRFFITEPIVSVLSLLSGFSDALIFMQIQSLGEVYAIWGFTTVQTGLAFIPFGIGYIMAFLIFIPIVKRNHLLRQRHPLNEYMQYERRLQNLLWLAPCLPFGLILFAWTSLREAHWIGPMFGTVFIGIANYAIYMATIDYMVAAYGPYSASATGGNGFARDCLAGILTWAAKPYYTAFTFEYGLPVANTVMAGISMLLVAATVVIYKQGSQMRAKSPFAQSLSRTRGTAGAAPADAI